MPEPIAVAFVEVLPETAGFRAATEAQLRRQLAGTNLGVPPSPATAASTRQLQGLSVAAAEATTATTVLAASETANAEAATAAAAAEGRAALATKAHAASAREAQEAIFAQTATLTGLRGASLGVNPAFLAATAGVIALFKSLREADKFAETMHLIEAATHAARGELEAARGTAIGLGRDLTLPLTTALGAAQAINLLTRSGFSLEDSMTAARGALLLTAASGADLETSVREIDRILDSFNLTAEDSVRVADAVATGLRFTQGNAEEFAQALGTLAPAADSLGLSLEATNTLVLQLSESGLSATAAAGSLRQAFLKLVAGGKGVEDGLKRAGLVTAELFDQFGKLRPDAFVILGEAIDKFNSKQQLSILTQIFSRRAALGVIRIIDQQREGYERMTVKAHEAGVAQEEAAAKARSFGGQLEELQDDVADVSLKMGTLAQGPATLFVKALRDIARQADRAVTAIDLLGGGVVTLGTDFVEAIPHARDFLGVLQDIAGAQRDPTGFLGGLIKDIPGQFKDAAAGLNQAIKLNVGGIADIPGIRELADNLDKLANSFDTTRGDVKKSLDGMNRDVEDGVNGMADRLRSGATLVASAASQLALAIAQAQARGDVGGELAGLRQQEARQKAFIARQAALPQTKARVATETKANQDLAATRAKIQAILDQRVSDAKGAAADAKSAADKLLKAAEERDQAFIAGINAEQTRREARVSATASTEALGDDIKANAALRDFLRRVIEEVRKRVREARQAGHETKGLKAELQALRLAKADVRREIQRLRKEAQEQRAATLLESAQLDVQILETRAGDDPTKGQNARLIAAHRRVIALLKADQKRHHDNKLEVKRLQLEIEQELAAIRDLRKTQAKGQGDALALKKQEFEFLQTLQGFSFNLLGNLIPGGATAGLVGGSAGGRPPGTTTSQASRVAAVGARTRSTAEASRLQPVTSGQGNTQIELLRKIHHQLRLLTRSQEHPEAHRQRRDGSAAGDNSYQGTHGM